MLGVKTMGEGAALLGGVENIHTFAERTTALRVADKNAAAAIKSADLTRLGAVAQGYITMLSDTNGDIAKAEGNWQLGLTGTPQEIEAYNKYKAGLYKVREEITAKLEPIQGAITERGNTAAGAKSRRDRPKAEGKKEGAPESGLPPVGFYPAGKGGIITTKKGVVTIPAGKRFEVRSNGTIVIEP
jgi:hypothetical protein